jgi:hypothetical protein
MPWESTIRAAALNIAFWDRHLEKPAMRAEYRQRGGGTPAFTVGGLHEDGGLDQRGVKRDRTGKERGGKGSKDKDGKKKGDVDAQRGDGRYFQSRQGVQICFQFSRFEDGCKTTCPMKRAHICEFCRQPHRTIHCPQHKNWVPPADKGGKGSKK